MDWPSQLVAVVLRFLVVANTTGSARPQIPAGIPIDWRGRIHYDVRMASLGEEQIMPSLEKDRLAAEAMQG